MHWVLEKKRTETIVDKAGDKSVDMWITCLWICGQVVDNLG
jgi:hypothetical protein